MSIRVTQADGILEITLQRPEVHNALSLELGSALTDTWRTFREDPELRVAILTGEGERSFSTGADLKQVRAWHGSMTSIQRREQMERQPGLGGITRNMDPGKPIIAAVNGYCLGGGLELALACDIRIAADHATFGLPEVGWGIIPGAGGTQRLPRAIPLGVAMEMMLSGEAIDAATALRVGLVNRVVPLDRLMDEARALATRIARNAPLAVQAARTAALHGLGLPLHEGLRLEQFYAEPLRSTEDAREGPLAFAEKRRPVFEGR